MSGSVRQFLLWRVHGLLNHIVERIAKHLGEHDTQPHSGADDDLKATCLNPGASEGQLECAVDVARFNQKVGAAQRGVALVYHDPVYVAYAQRLAAPNHHLIAHQKSPIGTIFDGSRLNMTAGEIMALDAAGVEP